MAISCFQKRPVLSPEKWAELQEFITGEEVQFPLTSEAVVHALRDMGISVTRFVVNRAIQTASLTVLKKGRERAWSFANLRAIWEFIVSGGEGEHTFDRFGSVPDWMSMPAAQFEAMLLSADAVCDEWMKYVKTHGLERKDPWYYPPKGSVMLYGSFPKDRNGGLLPVGIRYVPARRIIDFPYKG